MRSAGESEIQDKESAFEKLKAKMEERVGRNGNVYVQSSKFAGVVHC
jgi:hypothetical protein